jgi:hypothetical protein
LLGSGVKVFSVSVRGEEASAGLGRAQAKGGPLTTRPSSGKLYQPRCDYDPGVSEDRAGTVEAEIRPLLRARR